MPLDIAIRGDLEKLYRAQAEVVDRGLRRSLARATGGLRSGLRRAIRGAGFQRGAGGQALVDTVRRTITGRGLDLEGRVYSKAVLRRTRFRAAPVDLVGLFGEGATIRAARGTYLAIPTEYAPFTRGRGGGRRRATPSETTAQGLRLAFLRTPRGGVLVKHEAGRSVVTHVLVRQVSLRPRYRLEPIITRWTTRWPELIVAEIARAEQRHPILRTARPAPSAPPSPAGLGERSGG